MLFALFIVLQTISLGQVQGSSCTAALPGQLRVAFRGANGVTISWATNGTNGVNDTPNPQVTYGTNSTLVGGVLSSVGTTSSYGSPSFFHNVPLFNLASSTTYYYYIVASPPCVLQSAIKSFTTPPAVGSLTAVNIALVADLGNNPGNGGNAQYTINALVQAAKNTNFFIHSGDITYADDPEITGIPYENTWNTWQNNMVNLTANNIYMTVPGNHEVTCDQASGDSSCTGSNAIYRNFSAYLNRFRMPGNESGGFTNMWYSFDYGIVHVVVINTETDFPNAPSGPGTSLNGGNFKGTTQQQAWFAADLQAANANRAKVPWILVTGHRPFYSSLPLIPPVAGDCSACATAFASYMVQYNVDFYFCGHVHWYERFYPIYANGTVVAKNYNYQQGFIQITNGAGGAAEGKATAAALSTYKASAKIVSEYGYTRLELRNATYAVLTYIKANGNVTQDSVNIYRNH